MKAYLPEFRIEKLFLDSAHEAYAAYEYCGRETITPFIDLNTGHFTYKDPPLMRMASRSVRWDYVCIKRDILSGDISSATGTTGGSALPMEAFLLWGIDTVAYHADI